MIRPVALSDAPKMVDIYNYYILNSTATFEIEALDTVVMEERIRLHNSTLPWLVYLEKNELVGYAYATPWKTRAAYKHSVEVSVYVRNGYHGMGIGKALYEKLLKTLKKAGIHAVMGGIALPNEASIILHEKFGFEKVAHFKAVGFKFGGWRDVGYWQLLLDQD